MRRTALAIVFLLVIGSGWTALWFYGAHLAAAQLKTWIESEAVQGRVWTCPGRAIGGYPLSLTVSCRDATFAGRGLGYAVQASVAGLTADASLLHPTAIGISFTPPLSYRTSDRSAALTAKWSALTIDLDGLPDVRKAALTGRDIEVRGNFGAAGEQGGRAATLAATFYAVTQAVPAVDFHVVIDGIAMPVLNAFLGGEQPVDADVTGRLEHAVAGDARTPEEAIDRWRRAGGVVDVAKARLSRGESHVTAQGQLRLDDAHRPQGRLDAEFVGLAPILKRYGIDGNLEAAGSLLSSLFGGGSQKAPSEPGALALPLTFKKGHLGVGPITTPVTLLPLY